MRIKAWARCRTKRCWAEPQCERSRHDRSRIPALVSLDARRFRRNPLRVTSSRIAGLPPRLLPFELRAVRGCKQLSRWRVASGVGRARHERCNGGLHSYQLLYLLEVTEHYSPFYHLLKHRCQSAAAPQILRPPCLPGIAHCRCGSRETHCAPCLAVPVVHCCNAAQHVAALTVQVEAAHAALAAVRQPHESARWLMHPPVLFGHAPCAPVDGGRLRAFEAQVSCSADRSILPSVPRHRSAHAEQVQPHRRGSASGRQRTARRCATQADRCGTKRAARLLPCSPTAGASPLQRVATWCTLLLPARTRFSMRDTWA